MTMGFETLPRNDAAALMNHLATKGDDDDDDEDVDGGEDQVDVESDNYTNCSGPLSASVAASDWSAYHGGVFDGCDYNGNMVTDDC